MTDDTTLGGYLREHRCPPAFQGLDGSAYSAEAFIDDTPDDDGKYGAAVLFVRWSDADGTPDGHLETPYLAYEETPSQAKAFLNRLTLYELKAHLDQLIEKGKGRLTW